MDHGAGNEARATAATAADVIDRIVSAVESGDLTAPPGLAHRLATAALTLRISTA